MWHAGVHSVFFEPKSISRINKQKWAITYTSKLKLLPENIDEFHIRKASLYLQDNIVSEINLFFL